MKYLIDQFLFSGANFTTVNKEMHTPFLCAAIRGYTKVCKAFIDKGISFKDTDADRKNFIHLAAERNHANFLEVNNS